MNAVIPKRSHATSLDNDELLLLDAIVEQYSIATSQLNYESYSICMNTSYAHGVVKDEDLRRLLQAMQSKQYIVALEVDADDADSRWGISKLGFRWGIAELGLHLWEVERGALWERYVTHWQGGGNETWEDNTEEDSGLEYPVLCVTSPTLSAAQSCLDAMIECECNIFAPLRSDERVHITRTNYVSYELANRVFPVMHFLFVPTFEDNYKTRNSNGALYAERKNWWNSLKDLETLRKKLGLSF